MQKPQNRIRAVRFLPERGGIEDSGVRQAFGSDGVTVLRLNPERFRMMSADFACFGGGAGIHPGLRM
jgi:hypothetical protein